MDKEKQIISLLAVVEPKQRAALRKRFGLPEESSGEARTCSEDGSVTSHKSRAEKNVDGVLVQDKKNEVAKCSEESLACMCQESLENSRVWLVCARGSDKRVFGTAQC